MCQLRNGGASGIISRMLASSIKLLTEGNNKCIIYTMNAYTLYKITFNRLVILVS